MVSEKTRKFVLERDNNRCQFDAVFGMVHLSGMPCSEDLQMHHKTYERYGHELPEDLVTVCSRHHDVITNTRRHEHFLLTGEYDVPDVINDRPKLSEPTNKIEREHKHDNAKIPHRGRITSNNAQRRVSKPHQHLCKIYKRDKRETQED